MTNGESSHWRRHCAGSAGGSTSNSAVASKGVLFTACHKPQALHCAGCLCADWNAEHACRRLCKAGPHLLTLQERLNAGCQEMYYACCKVHLSLPGD